MKQFNFILLFLSAILAGCIEAEKPDHEIIVIGNGLDGNSTLLADLDVKNGLTTFIRQQDSWKKAGEVVSEKIENESALVIDWIVKDEDQKLLIKMNEKGESVCGIKNEGESEFKLAPAIPEIDLSVFKDQPLQWGKNSWIGTVSDGSLVKVDSHSQLFLHAAPLVYFLDSQNRLWIHATANHWRRLDEKGENKNFDGFQYIYEAADKKIYAIAQSKSSAMSFYELNEDKSDFEEKWNKSVDGFKILGSVQNWKKDSVVAHVIGRQRHHAMAISPTGYQIIEGWRPLSKDATLDIQAKGNTLLLISRTPEKIAGWYCGDEIECREISAKSTFQLRDIRLVSETIYAVGLSGSQVLTEPSMEPADDTRAEEVAEEPAGPDLIDLETPSVRPLTLVQIFSGNKLYDEQEIAGDFKGFRLFNLSVAEDDPDAPKAAQKEESERSQTL